MQRTETRRFLKNFRTENGSVSQTDMAQHKNSNTIIITLLNNNEQRRGAELDEEEKGRRSGFGGGGERFLEQRGWAGIGQDSEDQPVDQDSEH